MEIFSVDGKSSKTIELPEGFMIIRKRKDETFGGFFACKIEDYDAASNSGKIDIYEILKNEKSKVYEVYMYNDVDGPQKKSDQKVNYYNCSEGTCTYVK